MRYASTFRAFAIASILACCQPAWAQGGVKIGVLTDMTGIYSDFAGEGSVTAARMAVEDFGGSVLGRPIEIVSADHGSRPEIGSEIARRWFDREGVDAIVDVPGSAIALAVQQIALAKDRVLLITGSGSGDLTGKGCTRTSSLWTVDTYALAAGTGTALVKAGGDAWYVITVDNLYGRAQQADLTAAVQKAGGRVVGSSLHPFATQDFSALLLQAQASGANVLALANGGGDTVKAITQAAEFGLGARGMRIAAASLIITDVKAIGLDVAQGAIVTESFYWDMNDEVRAWSRRFMDRMGGKAPSAIQASVYSSVTHFLKAVRASGSRQGATVAARMRETPIEDPMIKGARIREDGRVMRDFHLFQIKAPAESSGPWDLYRELSRIPAVDAARPAADSACPALRPQ